MAKIRITGIREYSFFDEDSKRQVEGLSVYYIDQIKADEGKVGKGYSLKKLTVRLGTELFTRLSGLKYDQPIEADAVFDLLPGASRPALIDIKL